MHLKKINKRWLIAIALLAVISILGFYLKNKYFPTPKYILQDADFAQTVLINTNYGPIKIELDKKRTIAMAHFVRLVRTKFYDGVRFHHIAQNLLIQTGDPLTKYIEAKEFWGQGGLSSTFPLEVLRNDKMEEGTVALADTGTHSFGSQFFILTKSTPWMKGRGTIVGKVVEGMDTVNKIKDTEVDAIGTPKEDIYIITVIAI